MNDMAPEETPEARMARRRENFIRNATCKGCGAEPKAPGSSRCTKCSMKHKERAAAQQVIDYRKQREISKTT